MRVLSLDLLPDGRYRLAVDEPRKVRKTLALAYRFPEAELGFEVANGCPRAVLAELADRFAEDEPQLLTLPELHLVYHGSQRARTVERSEQPVHVIVDAFLDEIAAFGDGLAAALAALATPPGLPARPDDTAEAN